MNRVYTGAISGFATMLAIGAILWSSGLMHLGRVPDQEGAEMAMNMPVGDEHAGMDMANADNSAATMPSGAVMITPERQRLIGVRTALVTTDDVVRNIRTVGSVEYNETRVAHIHPRVTGWIEELYVDFTGKLVEANQPLLGIYSPELVATQEEYLLALRAQDSLGASVYAEVSQTTRSLLQATRRRLLLWDITETQIAELEQRREPQTILTLHSPITGFVIHKNAYEGAHVGPDSELFTIADLSDVWVTADIYESDLPYVREGQSVTVTLSFLPGQTFRGQVDYIYPYLDGETRTATVRVTLANPDAALKPGMFANVELTTRLGKSLVVPEDAVIDTGARQVVFLVLEGGHFLPREVVVGLRFDGRLQILSGLEANDEVVSGAAFLIDSESKLRSSIDSMPGMDMSSPQH
jgi:RND family efflux transporter MFP subunit